MKLKVIIVFVLIVVILSGCGRRKEEATNIEQLYQQNGVPVKIKIMEPELFIRELPYTAILTGIRQSSAAAMIGGRIDKIHVEVGDYVEKDSILMEFPEDAPAAQYQQAKSGYELAKATYERMKNLYALGGISKQELESAETQFKVNEANWDAAQQMLKVRAPISGYVTSITVRETDNVERETVLAVVAKTDEMKARVWVTENEICDIMEGMQARAVWNNLELNGYVTQVAMAMDFDHNAFGVDIIFENSKNMCKSGVTADIFIVSYKNSEALMVERKVVQTDRDGKYIFKISQNLAEKSYIETGRSNGSYELIKGVTIGDSVIVEGLNLISNGDKVMVVN